MNISTPENVNNLKIRLLIQKVLTLYICTQRENSLMEGTLEWYSIQVLIVLLKMLNHLLVNYDLLVVVVPTFLSIILIAEG